MFVYLSKKIAIPNNIRLNCIAWNQKQGYIAVGGEDGLLKVIRAESNPTDATNSSNKGRSITATSNLSMNQTLEGHNGHVQVVTWNEEHQKLTSSDQNGVIIVWMLYKGSWYEEMINNRNKSVVKGMTWSSNGQKICIVYEDGAVIVGSVEGNRIWGKELKGLSLTAVQWSPEAKFLLFGSKTGEAHLYDDQGTFLTKLDSISDRQSHAMVALHWYDGRNGYVAFNCPVLAACFINGRICLLRDTSDDNPLNIDTGVSIVSCVWNTFGSMLAVVGTVINQDRKESNVVCFYSVFGDHLKTLKIPGKEVSCCSWEGGSLRIALSVDSNIYFANIRPNYKWAYFNNTIVFTDERVGRDGVCVTFWNVVSNARYFKYVMSVLEIAAHGEHCVIAAENDPAQGQEQYVLLVCNAISTPVDTKYLEFKPCHLIINSSTVVIASESYFLLWNFRAPRNSSLNAGKPRRDRLYHADDAPTGVAELIHDLDGEKSREQSMHRPNSLDPISCLAATDELLLLGRDSGTIQQYSLPQLTLTRRHLTARRPRDLRINCDSTTATVIDSQGLLRLLELVGSRDRTVVAESQAVFERRDAWAASWAEDNPRLLAVLEKNRMYVFRGTEPEEPVACIGYVCRFRDLEIRCVLLDELVRTPEPRLRELLRDIELKSLRDTRDLLARVGPNEAEAFARDHAHPRLWRLLAEHALRRLDLETAEAALVRCSDYLAVRFVKRLRGVQDPSLRRAEASAFLGEHDEAEQALLELDRRDLAAALRLRLADLDRALQLLQLAPAGSSDEQLERCERRRGKQLASLQKWAAAREHLERGRGSQQLLDCHFRLEDHEALSAAAARIPDGDAPALRSAARLLAAAGLCKEAVGCLVRCGDARQAVETCVRSNRWDRALELARSYRLGGIGELLGQYARYLLRVGRRLQAVELYRKAERPREAAKLLIDLAIDQARARAPPLRLKKLYVLAALLTGGIQVDAWRGAEAYHFLLLTHRQLYAGEPEAALRTALRLREHEELLGVEPIYTLLALAAAGSRALRACSRALVRLEALDVRYEDLALELFGRRAPRDARPAMRLECRACDSLVPEDCIACPSCTATFPACVVTGRSLSDLSRAWLCTVCGHRAGSERDVVNVNGCPLCHSIVGYM